MKRISCLLLTLCLFFIVAPACFSSIISISNISIDPTGFEDQQTGEWKGSYWVVSSTVDTTESFLVFNEQNATVSSLNEIDGKTILPTSTVKITIIPKQPYWEIPLRQMEPILIYPKTFGTHFKTYAPNLPEKTQNFVPALYLTTLEPILPYRANLFTPFDVTVEKVGENPFQETVHFDTLGGTDSVTVSNPSDSTEKVLIQDLGKLFTGISTPALEDMLIINKNSAFKKTEVIDHIKYGRDSTGIIENECYAFYWFGGGEIYTVNDNGNNFVRRWDDDSSPNHLYIKELLGPIGTQKLVRDFDFPGSYRIEDQNFGLDQYIYPIPAVIEGNNPNANSNYIGPVFSLIDYLNNKFSSSVLDLNYLQQGWTITEDNKLRIIAPTASSSSLITMKISSELTDSIVYQPPVGNGKCEDAYWESSKTTQTSIERKDTAILKVKQLSSENSKIEVLPTVPNNLPISISPQMDSYIINSGDTHDFRFEIQNLGTDILKSSTITFTIKNDLGDVTDSCNLDFEITPLQVPSEIDTENTDNTPNEFPSTSEESQNSQQQSLQEGSSDNSNLILIVIVVAIGIVAVFLFYYFKFRKREILEDSNTNPPPTPPSLSEKSGTSEITPKPKKQYVKVERSTSNKKPSKKIGILLVIIVTLTIFSVYYYFAYNNLQFELGGVSLGAVDYTHAEVRLTLLVENPNLLPIYIPSGDFEIYLNNQHLGHGDFGSVMIGGKSQGRVSVPLEYYYTDTPFVLYGLLTGGGRITVKLEGSANIILFSVPFETTLYDVQIE